MSSIFIANVANCLAFGEIFRIWSRENQEKKCDFVRLCTINTTVITTEALHTVKYGKPFGFVALTVVVDAMVLVHLGYARVCVQSLCSS